MDCMMDIKLILVCALLLMEVNSSILYNNSECFPIKAIFKSFDTSNSEVYDYIYSAVPKKIALNIKCPNETEYISISKVDYIYPVKDHCPGENVNCSTENPCSCCSKPSGEICTKAFTPYSCDGEQGNCNMSVPVYNFTKQQCKGILYDCNSRGNFICFSRWVKVQYTCSQIPPLVTTDPTTIDTEQTSPDQVTTDPSLTTTEQTSSDQDKSGSSVLYIVYTCSGVAGVVVVCGIVVIIWKREAIGKKLENIRNRSTAVPTPTSEVNDEHDHSGTDMPEYAMPNKPKVKAKPNTSNDNHPTEYALQQNVLESGQPTVGDPEVYSTPYQQNSLPTVQGVTPKSKIIIENEEINPVYESGN